MEPAYGTVIAAVRLLQRVQGLRFTVTGTENLPRTGGAVVAINHTSYLDFTFAGLPFYLQRPTRLVRFMAKQEVFDHRITGPIMRSLRHIPVDRSSGAGSFDAAVRARAEKMAARSPRDGEGAGMSLTPLTVTRSDSGAEYRFVTVSFDRAQRVAELTVRGPSGAEALREGGAAAWWVAAWRELDDALLDLRFNQLELGTVILRTVGEIAAVRAWDEALLAGG